MRSRGDKSRYDDEVWVFENHAGITNERWFHSAGCRRWLTVRRDTNADRVVEIA